MQKIRTVEIRRGGKNLGLNSRAEAPLEQANKPFASGRARKDVSG